MGYRNRLNENRYTATWNEVCVNDSIYENTVSQEFLMNFGTVAIIPAYNVEREIESVLRSMPAFLQWIIVIDDASVDRTSEVVERFVVSDRRVILIRHEHNQGVGGAMVTGFRRALELRAQIIAKVDGDGQMNTDYLGELFLPLIRGEADYSKGNRFRDFQALRRMPALRRIGNLGLSFCTKAAVGYWNCFDPTNGFVAIRGDILAQLPLERIHQSYFFETSMLSQLYLLGAVVRDVPMPARYGAQGSNLSIKRVLTEFPRRLVACFCRRLVLKKFIYDFNMESIFLMAGIPILLAGALYGGYNWVIYGFQGIPAPTGTVVISALLIILGFQILLTALGMDLQASPREPICRGPLRGNRTPAAPQTLQEKAEGYVEHVEALFVENVEHDVRT